MNNFTPNPEAAGILASQQATFDSENAAAELRLKEPQPDCPGCVERADRILTLLRNESLLEHQIAALTQQLTAVQEKIDAMVQGARYDLLTRTYVVAAEHYERLLADLTALIERKDP